MFIIVFEAMSLWKTVCFTATRSHFADRWIVDGELLFVINIGLNQDRGDAR
jgi:hypothetical protein